jgi:hypothetical protein
MHGTVERASLTMCVKEKTMVVTHDIGIWIPK